MSNATCARSGGAVVYMAKAFRHLAFGLAGMQRAMDKIAAGPSTEVRFCREAAQALEDKKWLAVQRAKWADKQGKQS